MEIALSDGTITAPSAKLTLKKLVYYINDKYEGEVKKETLVFVNEYAEPDEVLDELWKFLDTGEDEDVVHETCEIVDAHVYTCRFDELSQRKYQLRKALKIAREQRSNYANQVSGVWSINAMDFCEEYGLDFNNAMDLQEEANENVLRDTMDSTVARIQAQVGELTDKQLNKVRDDIEKNWDNSAINEAFWEAVISQIKKELE